MAFWPQRAALRVAETPPLGSGAKFGKRFFVVRSTSGFEGSASLFSTAEK